MSNPWKQNESPVDDDVMALWDETPVDELPIPGAIPAGKYKARIVDGALETAHTGNKCFKLRWVVVGGEFAERRLVSRHWLTARAIGRTKGELVPLGVNADHLRGACSLPLAIAELSVVQRSDEAGDLFNEVKRVSPIKQQASTATASQAGAQDANESKPASTPVPSVETPQGAPQAADDDFLDEEF